MPGRRPDTHRLRLVGTSTTALSDSLPWQANWSTGSCYDESAVRRRDFLAGLTVSALGLTACGSSAPTRGASDPTSVGSTLPDLVDWRITRWRTDPWARGAYSYLAPGTSSTTRKTLAQPVDARIFFAGEATDLDHPATVHGALASGRRAAAEVLATAPPGPVVVVGAGAAGLGTARDLVAAGRSVVVLEARDRIGGRVWSVDIGDAVVDLGGSWLHGLRDNPLTKITESLGIELVPTDYEDALLFDSNGAPVPWGRLDDQYGAIKELLDGSRSTRSMAPAVEQLRSNFSGDGRRFLEYVLASEIDHWFAAGPEDLAFSGVHEGSWSRGGDAVPRTSYRPIIDWLATDLDLRLGQPVHNIQLSPHGVTVTSDQDEYRGGAVVVTVPLGVLQAGTIRFQPALPRPKNTAINSLGMGVMDKVVLRFDEAFWDSEVDLFSYASDPPGHFIEWYNAVPWTGRPVLVGFNAGRPADEMESWSDTETLAAALDILGRIRW